MTSISSVCLGDLVGLPVEVAMLSMSMENYVCACSFVGLLKFFKFDAHDKIMVFYFLKVYSLFLAAKQSICR